MSLPDHFIDEMIQHSVDNRGHKIIFKAHRHVAVLPGERNEIHVEAYCEGRIPSLQDPRGDHCEWVTRTAGLEGRVWNSG